MNSEPGRTTFLGLPRELRDVVYVLVLEADMDYKVSYSTIRSTRINDSERVKGVFTTQVPWTSLMLTCMTIASELRMAQNKLAPSSKTYIGEIRLKNKKFGSKCIVWKRLPCYPHQATKWIVNMPTERRINLGGCGGVNPVFKDLFNIMKHFFQFGPTLVPQRGLRQQIHLHELLVIYHRADAIPGSELGFIIRYASYVANVGVLSGMLDSIKIATSEKNVVEVIPVQEGETGSVPAFWKQNGFDWAVRPYNGLPKKTIPKKRRLSEASDNS